LDSGPDERDRGEEPGERAGAAAGSGFLKSFEKAPNMFGELRSKA
jgi:hypothetical protein